MIKHTILFSISAVALAASAHSVIETPAYRWENDTIFQGQYFATAPTETQIVSTYSAQPGYYMGIEREWKLKNDISRYPRLSSPDRLHCAVYNMGLDEMVNAVEPDTTLRTGKEWAGVWTRDVSYSILLSMAYMQPEASKISLMRKVDSLGRIIQDTGSGGAWPVSTDREIWAVAAWEIYKVTGERSWLEYIYPVIKRSLETDRAAFYDTESGLTRGETSFIDWREQSHPRWMQCADIYNSETLSTSVVHARAWYVLGEIATLLGDKDVAKEAFAQSRKIADAVNEHLWLDDKGYYAMYRYGRDNLIVNPRVETLGESLAILWGVADAERALEISRSNPVTPFGTAVFYPYIADMPAYHNKSQWPWVASWWALASAKAGNPAGVLEAFGSVMRPAALFCTNKENFNIENGDIATELNSSNMLWCLSGNLALTHKLLFGIEFEKDGLAFHPFVPEAFGGRLTLSGFVYRDAVLDIEVNGYGNEIKSFKVNGKEQKPFIAAKKAKGRLKVEIVLADNSIADPGINRVENLNAPLTPIAWIDGDELVWNPIEYIGHYVVLRNGKEIARTRATSYRLREPGEYQVTGVTGDGVAGFASEPRSNRREVYYDAGSLLNGKESVLEIPVEAACEGDYFISLKYGNGNGPVNTENKCAIRTLSVDGVRVGTAVLPHRGVDNWDDLGWSNSVKVHMPAGVHMLRIDFRPEDENMNIGINEAVIVGVRVTEG